MGVDDPREARWMLRAAFVGGAACACLATGAALNESGLVLIGVGLLLAAYAFGVIAEACAGGSEQQAPSGAYLIAGGIAFGCVALAAALLSSVVAIFVGAAAFRWMAVCLPLAAAWLVLSRVIGRIARGIARRRRRA